MILNQNYRTWVRTILGHLIELTEKAFIQMPQPILWTFSFPSQPVVATEKNRQPICRINLYTYFARSILNWQHLGMAISKSLLMPSLLMGPVKDFAK